MSIKFQAERKLFNRWQRKECMQMVTVSDFEGNLAVNVQTDPSLIRLDYYVMAQTGAKVGK
jgi:hypothetical protein